MSAFAFVAVFVLGMAAMPTAKLCAEFARQMRDLWRGLEYYEQLENIDNLTWVGKAAARCMRCLRRAS
jgi:hypothetical protein